MEGPGSRDLLELLPELRHAVADQPAVGLDLGLAGAAEEAEAAALALEVGPGPDQPARLIVEMGELDLKPALGGRGALAEDLEDQPGAVDHLGLGAVLEILLLDRRDRAVDDQQLGVALAKRVADPLDLPRPEQGRRLGLADAEMQLVLDRDADRLGEPGRLVEPRVGAAQRLLAEVGKGDDGSGAAGELGGGFALRKIQLAGSSPCASTRLTGRSGCTVEMACL